MNNISHYFDDVYLPQKALVIYRSPRRDADSYIESYDFDETGRPINAHPLSQRESSGLAEALKDTRESESGFLTPKSLLPGNVLYLRSSGDGFAIWSTPARRAGLFFAKSLGIPNGEAEIPALIWKATRQELWLYALKTDQHLTEKTILYYAPFFNIYKNGLVCMGTVDIDIDRRCFLEGFIKQWQDYFFNSYFSHLIDGYYPVSDNIVSLWQKQVGCKRKFPVSSLIKNGLTIKNLLL